VRALRRLLFNRKRERAEATVAPPALGSRLSTLRPTVLEATDQWELVRHSRC